MRQLNSEELLTKFNSYSSDINYSNFNNIDVKINQLFNFLNEQEISKRILERINEDFLSLKEKLSIEFIQKTPKFYKEIKLELKTRELQGAFAYFNINEKYTFSKNHSNKYIDLVFEFYDVGGNFREMKDEFITYFWEPFHEIFDWYMYESDIKTENDYFSQKKQEDIFEKLNEMETMLTKLGFGQEIVFNEMNDLRKLTKKLNKKNWSEIIKGKFIDLGLSGIISVDVAKKVIEILTGSEVNLLN
jgi:hypothetical protein